MSSSFPSEGELHGMVSASMQEVENNKVLLASMQTRLNAVLSNDKTGPNLRFSPERTISETGPAIYSPSDLIHASKDKKLKRLHLEYLKPILAEQEVTY